MVNRSRGQSRLAPSRRSWRVMVPPLSAFHCQTRSRKAARPMLRRSWLPSAVKRRSTTICVAMPAWSVPGCHSASRPCIRRQRISASCSVKVSACPMCRLPVTLGGGIMMVKGCAGLSGWQAKAPDFSQPSYRRGSNSAGVRFLSSMPSRPSRREPRQERTGGSRVKSGQARAASRADGPAPKPGQLSARPTTRSISARTRRSTIGGRFWSSHCLSIGRSSSRTTSSMLGPPER